MSLPSLRSFFSRPLTDTFFGLERCLESGVRGLALVALGLVVGWWIYVPIHELLHAYACLATGGEVTRLDIDPLYGGKILEGLIPWVKSGGEYAGQLSGFDTGGCDFVYLATVFGPYLLTLLPGVWLLRRAAMPAPEVRQGNAFLYGVSLPIALAPFISLPGDTYEIGSIVGTWIPPWRAPEAREMLRGDDVFKIGESLSETGAGGGLWIGMFAAILLGLLWAFATYGVGALIARKLGRGPVTALERRAKQPAEHRG